MSLQLVNVLMLPAKCHTVAACCQYEHGCCIAGFNEHRCEQVAYSGAAVYQEGDDVGEVCVILRNL